MRVIIRDAKGELVTARARSRHLCSPLMSESEVALLALRTAQALRITKLVVEEDSVEVINALKGALEECPREIKLCIEDCKRLFLSFSMLTFKHVSRLGNKAAYAIARNGFDGPNALIWTPLNPPIWLSKVMKEDAILLSTWIVMKFKFYQKKKKKTRAEILRKEKSTTRLVKMLWKRKWEVAMPLKILLIYLNQSLLEELLVVVD